MQLQYQVLRMIYLCLECQICIAWACCISCDGQEKKDGKKIKEFGKYADLNMGERVKNIFKSEYGFEIETNKGKYNG